jgi:hypothetical protein
MAEPYHIDTFPKMHELGATALAPNLTSSYEQPLVDPQLMQR